MAGSVQKRLDTHGKAYYMVRVEYPTDAITGKREQKSEAHPKKKKADARLAEWLTEIERGTAVDGTKMTVGEWLMHWLDTTAKHVVRRTTLAGYTATITHHIIPMLGSVPLTKLTPAQVQGFYAKKMSGGVQPRTVQLCHMRLSQALKHAVRLNVVARNVCDVIDPPRVSQKSTETWTASDARRFLAAAESDTYNPLWLLALTTGMRRGELLGLRWQDVDTQKGIAYVRQSVVCLNGAPHIQEPKTSAARRGVRLPLETLAALKAHRARQNERRLAVGTVWKNLDLIFTTGDGGPLNPNNVQRNFLLIIGRVNEKAGDGEKLSRIRFHDMRHTHATLLLKSGQPVKVVSERLGHAKASITMDVYAHVLPGMQEEAAAAVSTLFFDPPVNERLGS